MCFIDGAKLDKTNKLSNSFFLETDNLATETDKKFVLS